MLALAVLGLLAAAAVSGPAIAGPADTSLRVPGTTLRFGLADTLVAARGFTPAGPGSLAGPCRFFGLEGEARLGFTDGHLDRAEFTLAAVSPHQRDYVQDRLRALGYRRRGEPAGTAMGDGEWSGRTQVRLTTAGDRWLAVVTPPAGVGPDAGTVPAVPTPQAAVIAPVLPETLHVSVPARPGRRGEAAVREVPRCLAPTAARPDGTAPRVHLLLLVDTDGSVLEANVLRGLPTLDPVALGCARRWRFEPRTWQGAPCRFRVEVPLDVAFE